MKEYSYEKLLNIRTSGIGVPNSLIHYHPYEPTPYEALEALFEQYEVHRTDHYVDFGCGLGRLNFYIHYFYHASVIGVEMNEIFYRKAIKNKKQYAKKLKRSIDNKLQFICCKAEEYPISSKDNHFYFFNPFSIHIFQHVVNRILNSVEDHPREINLILYYPSEEYIFYLENATNFELLQEVVVPILSNRNANERFLIYRLK